MRLLSPGSRLADAWDRSQAAGADKSLEPGRRGHSGAPDRFDGNGDELLRCSGLKTFMRGWVDDRYDPTVACLINGVEAPFGRYVRNDVERAFASDPHPALGIWIVGPSDGVSANPPMQVNLVGASGAKRPLVFYETSWVSAEDQLNRVLAQVQVAQGALPHPWNVAKLLDDGLGEVVARAWERARDERRAVALDQIWGAGQVEASVVVPMLGKAEWIRIQQLNFSRDAAARRIEFIYVVNGEQHADEALRACELAHRSTRNIIRLVVLQGNAGFSAAANEGAIRAASARLIFMNPDVYDMSSGTWLSSVLEWWKDQAAASILFGCELTYPDGACMHAGMYIESEAQFGQTLLRVTHHGKGRLPGGTISTPLPATAVTGAVTGVDAELFQSLGGFDEDFVFGHYEDADLCLRARCLGTVPLLLPWPLVHVEGGGADPLSHESAFQDFNRWRFSVKWRDEPWIGNAYARD